MIKLKNRNKTDDFAAFFIKETDCQSIEIMVYMLFLLDLNHYFQTGRCATNISYRLAKNIEIEFQLEQHLKALINKNNLDYDKDKLSKREFQILQQIANDWAKAAPGDFLNYFRSKFNISTVQNHYVSFSQTLKNTSETTYEMLKENIEDHDNFLKNFSSPTTEDAPQQCGRAKS
ncbi:hypothetical protein [Candidatus Berkiella aquae]|uniref:Uncharacterized protein n=1 Tax=Candidatus Berkiella aquae TaxID=295108 RepID=A0A0Q9YVY0_9GAMM|nr:hypothetical protein [Candidatus Berkiella aquae]MCS5710435.1 hypothetical protein [Candidatus Berkiella aquae]